jgi:hypothetical protein
LIEPQRGNTDGLLSLGAVMVALVEHTNTTPQGPHAVLLTGWTALWNGDLAQASRICASTVRVRFGGQAIGVPGDEVATARELADLIKDFRSTRPGLTYSVVEARTTEDWGYCVWNASMSDLRMGGIRPTIHGYLHNDRWSAMFTASSVSVNCLFVDTARLCRAGLSGARRVVHQLPGVGEYAGAISWTPSSMGFDAAWQAR